MTIKNIIFDWSGVISDDLTQSYEANMYIFKKFRVNKLTKEEYKEAFFLPYLDFYKKYIPNAKKEEIDSLFIEALKRVSKPRIFIGVKETLEALNKRKIKMFVLSSHPITSVLEEAKDYGIKNLFEKIYGSVSNKIDEIKKLIEKNTLNIQETIFIGDMIHDIKSARSVNIRIAVVTYGYGSKIKLEKENPDFILNKFEEVMKIKK